MFQLGSCISPVAARFAVGAIALCFSSVIADLDECLDRPNGRPGVSYYLSEKNRFLPNTAGSKFTDDVLGLYVRSVPSPNKNPTGNPGNPPSFSLSLSLSQTPSLSPLKRKGVRSRRGSLA